MIEIRLDGQPIGKGRARFTRKGHAYTPEKTARFEDRLALEAQRVMDGRPLLTEALVVWVLAFVTIPKSKPALFRSAALDGRIRPVVKPDADNILKVLDALNQVVWVDDRQIADLHIQKYYSDRPRLELTIEELTDF